MVHIGTDVIPHKTNWTDEFTPPSRTQTKAVVEVYKTDQVPVPLTTESCVKVAELSLELTAAYTYHTTKPVIKVSMAFGGTTITVTAEEKGSRNPVKATFDCLK